MEKYTVKPCTRQDCSPFIIGIHYAARWPSVSHAFGLYNEDDLVGIVTYGTPASSTLRVGIAGPEYKVLELNRLCLKNNTKNEASFLVASSIKMLPMNVIVVSFADTEQGHVGYVYQACNFLYTGLSAKRTDWKVKGMEHLHGQTIADEFRGCDNRSKAMREKYGDDFYLKDRSRKHRYIFMHGLRKWKKQALTDLRYSIISYPKNK